MKIERIKYEQLFPTGEYANQRLSMEIVLEPHDFCEGEVPQIKVAEEAFEFAKKAVNDAFQKLNPGSTLTVNPEYAHLLPISQVEKPVETRIEVLIQDIEACTEIEGVNGISSWRKIVEKNPALQDAYDRTREKIIGRETKAILKQPKH